jgi:alkyl sulfatase BDS1-like metallo-beta-lactamase superfamily hydrolase
VRVTEGVYVAIGFGLANSIMIEGETGLIIGRWPPFPLFSPLFSCRSMQSIAWRVSQRQTL